MYNELQLFELSFVPVCEGYPYPRLVFAVDLDCLEELRARLLNAAIDYHDYAQEYCARGVEFSFGETDLLGDAEFGFEKCGIVLKTRDKARFEITLSSDRLSSSVLTMHMLVGALVLPFKDGKISNQKQQIDLELCCKHGAVYGHAVGGYLTDRVTKWLRAYGKSGNGADELAAPERVIEAMRQVWLSVTTTEKREFVDECWAAIADDGRFRLHCFGNACDLSIYPDALFAGEMADEFVRFSCHNLDSADQQVTLLAGLAVICDIARENE